MRKRFVILLAAIFLAFVAGLTWQFSGPREPMYEGKPLSYWLEGYNYSTSTETSQQSADEAMREIGTNAVPTLLEMIQEHDSRLKLKFFEVLKKQHFIKIKPIVAAERNYEAMKGFRVLGASARFAVPSLIKLCEQNHSDAAQYCAESGLGAIGPTAQDAIPILLKGMTSSNGLVYLNAISALGDIHSKPDLVLPVLIKSLEVEPKIDFVAIQAIGRFGADAKTAVPALIKEFSNTNSDFRSDALLALKQIDPQIAASVATNYPPISN